MSTVTPQLDSHPAPSLLSKQLCRLCTAFRDSRAIHSVIYGALKTISTQATSSTIAVIRITVWLTAKDISFGAIAETESSDNGKRRQLSRMSKCVNFTSCKTQLSADDVCHVVVIPVPVATYCAPRPTLS